MRFCQARRKFRGLRGPKEGGAFTVPLGVSRGKKTKADHGRRREELGAGLLEVLWIDTGSVPKLFTGSLYFREYSRTFKVWFRSFQ